MRFMRMLWLGLLLSKLSLACAINTGVEGGDFPPADEKIGTKSAFKDRGPTIIYRDHLNEALDEATLASLGVNGLITPKAFTAYIYGLDLPGPFKRKADLALMAAYDLVQYSMTAGPFTDARTMGQAIHYTYQVLTLIEKTTLTTHLKQVLLATALNEAMTKNLVKGGPLFTSFVWPLCGFLEKDVNGDPIPPKDGTLEAEVEALFKDLDLGNFSYELIRYVKAHSLKGFQEPLLYSIVLAHLPNRENRKRDFANRVRQYMDGGLPIMMFRQAMQSLQPLLALERQ